MLPERDHFVRLAEVPCKPPVAAVAAEHGILLIARIDEAVAPQELNHRKRQVVLARHKVDVPALIAVPRLHRIDIAPDARVEAPHALAERSKAPLDVLKGRRQVRIVEGQNIVDAQVAEEGKVELQLLRAGAPHGGQRRRAAALLLACPRDEAEAVGRVGLRQRPAALRDHAQLSHTRSRPFRRPRQSCRPQ